MSRDIRDDQMPITRDCFFVCKYLHTIVPHILSGDSILQGLGLWVQKPGRSLSARMRLRSISIKANLNRIYRSFTPLLSPIYTCFVANSYVI